MYVSYQQQGEH